MNRLLLLFLIALGSSCSHRKNDVDIKQASMGTATEKNTQETETSLEKALIKAGLVDVKKVDPTIFVELKYSTRENFVGYDVYGELSACYLQPDVAEKLRRAHQYLKSLYPSLRLKVYDGARPLSAQRILWDKLQKPDSLKHIYVASPEKGSIHNYGAAVDLTIATMDGTPLDMGTPFDYFGKLAYPEQEEAMLSAGKLTVDQVENRKLLRHVMTVAGFTPITSEWWHFNSTSRALAAQKYGLIE